MTVTHAGSDQLPVSQVGVRHLAPNPRASQRVLVAGLPHAECGDAPAKPAAPAAYYEAWLGRSGGGRTDPAPTIFADVKALYDLRSNLVHGAILKDPKNWLATVSAPDACPARSRPT
jgi:hypothetical protein